MHAYECVPSVCVCVCVGGGGGGGRVCAYVRACAIVFSYVCFIVIFIECFKLLVSQKNNVCVCVCVCVRACVRACVRVRNYILPGFNMLLHKCYL